MRTFPPDWIPLSFRFSFKPPLGETDKKRKTKTKTNKHTSQTCWYSVGTFGWFTFGSFAASDVRCRAPAPADQKKTACPLSNNHGSGQRGCPKGTSSSKTLLSASMIVGGRVPRRKTNRTTALVAAKPPLSRPSGVCSAGTSRRRCVRFAGTSRRERGLRGLVGFSGRPTFGTPSQPFGPFSPFRVLVV